MLLLSIILLKIILTHSSLTPLSECIEGRITAYTDYKSGGSCGFGPPKLYGAAPNEDFYNKGEKCGICYELIGPKGILYFMVDSFCPIEGNEASCSGDKFHFDLHKNGFLTIADEDLGKLNVTFRMVACNHNGNIIVKTKKEVSEYYYEFVVMNHKLGLKKVYYSFDQISWKELYRQKNYNHWKIEERVKLPLYLQFESISGEKVMTKIDEIKKGFSHDTGVQFYVPKDMYFTVDTLKDISGAQKEECCKLHDDFTQIYDEGKLWGEWLDTSTKGHKPNLENTAGCLGSNSKCLKVELVEWSCLQFYNRIGIDIKRYSGIEFYLKSEKECNECLRLKGKKEFFKIGTAAAGIWEKKFIQFEDLDFTESFKSLLFQGNSKGNFIFYFDDIKLIKSKNHIDNGTCYEYSSDYYLEKEESPSSNATTAVIVVFVILVVVGIGIGTFWYLRYKKRNSNNDIENIPSKTRLL